MPQTFRNFAKGKREWTDVLALIPPPPRGALRKATRQHPANNSASAASQSSTWHTQLKGLPVYGHPTPSPWLRHEPLNEQGVVLLFGMLAKSLGFMIENVQKAFPDCEAKRQIGPDRWQRVRIEFEFESRNYREHGHPTNGCDLIVCWRHNWDDCPKHLETVELSSALKSLANSGE